MRLLRLRGQALVNCVQGLELVHSIQNTILQAITLHLLSTFANVADNTWVDVCCVSLVSLSLTLQWESDFPMKHHSCLLCVWLYTRLGWCGFRSGKQSVASTLTLMNVWRGAHSQARPMLRNIYSFYFFKIVCICVLCAYMCTCKHSTFRVHKRVSDPLIWSHKQWELETELGAAERAE